jgi:dTDP-D-glucose 4,6-dehydratase
MTTAYHRYHGLDAKIVRIFNTYGPRMRVRDGRAVPAFISSGAPQRGSQVFGDGSQTRSFCYISDLVDGIIRLMLSDQNEPVNIGNPHEMTILEMAETIREMTGSTSRIVHRPLPEDDPKVRRPDITRARTLLGWEPKVPLRDGLTDTIAYFTCASDRAEGARRRGSARPLCSLCLPAGVDVRCNYPNAADSADRPPGPIACVSLPRRSCARAVAGCPARFARPARARSGAP